MYSGLKKKLSSLFWRKNIEKFYWLRLKRENRNSTHWVFWNRKYACNVKVPTSPSKTELTINLVFRKNQVGKIELNTNLFFFNLFFSFAKKNELRTELSVMCSVTGLTFFSTHIFPSPKNWVEVQLVFFNSVFPKNQFDVQPGFPFKWLFVIFGGIQLFINTL